MTVILSVCVNVCIYSLFIGSNLNLRNEQMQLLGLGALLHDIGKLYMPESLLRKGLSQEFHYAPLIGYRSPEGTDTPEEVGDIVRDHEKCDGSGYPTELARKFPFDQDCECRRYL